MKIKSLAALLFVIYMSACSRESNRHERFGRFIVTTHLLVDRLKWEGGNSRLDYTEVCRDDGQLCFRGDDDLRYIYSKNYGRLLVHSTKDIKIFNTVTGDPIKCDLSKMNERLKYGLYGYFSNSSAILYSRVLQNENELEQTDILSFKSQGCQLEKSFDSTDEIRDLDSQDTESGAVAWSDCNKSNCTFKWLEADFLTAHQKEIGCNENSNLDIIWINGVPEPRNRNGPKNQYCLNEAGELKYPFTPPGSYVPDDAPDARY
jgi:hypothetical protein